MSEQPILLENQGYVRWIKLNRPDVMNAITPKMLVQLNEELKAADDEIDVRVVIMTGTGKGFCSGLDLKQAAAGDGIAGGLTQGGARHLQRARADLGRRVPACAKPREMGKTKQVAL